MFHAIIQLRQYPTTIQNRIDIYAPIIVFNVKIIQVPVNFRELLGRMLGYRNKRMSGMFN